MDDKSMGRDISPDDIKQMSKEGEGSMQISQCGNMFIGFLPVSKLPETMQMRGPLSKPEITYGNRVLTVMKK